MKQLLVRSIFFLAVAFAAAPILRAQDDPRIGTWTLSVAKSRYAPGPPPAKEVRTYTALGHTIGATADSTDAQGNRVSLRYTANEDGKDYPMTGLPSADAIATRRVDARTFEAATKKNGKIIGTTRGAISQDGRTLVLAFTSIGPSGQPITNVAVYDKQ